MITYSLYNSKNIKVFNTSEKSITNYLKLHKSMLFFSTVKYLVSAHSPLCTKFKDIRQKVEGGRLHGNMPCVRNKN